MKTTNNKFKNFITNKLLIIFISFLVIILLYSYWKTTIENTTFSSTTFSIVNKLINNFWNFINNPSIFITMIVFILITTHKQLFKYISMFFEEIKIPGFSGKTSESLRNYFVNSEDFKALYNIPEKSKISTKESINPSNENIEFIKELIVTIPNFLLSYLNDIDGKSLGKSYDDFKILTKALENKYDPSYLSDDNLPEKLRNIYSFYYTFGAINITLDSFENILFTLNHSDNGLFVNLQPEAKKYIQEVLAEYT